MLQKDVYITETGPDEANKTGKSLWSKNDTVWMLSLYGTAIGAGTLFLPVNAGMHGFVPLILMLMVAFPMTFYSHQALCRFVLSGSGNKDITHVVDEHFGTSAGKMITLLYFFAIYPILLLYSVAITNTTESFIVHQLGMSAPPRALLAIGLILALMAIVQYGQTFIVKSMSILVYPFVVSLMLLSLYLVPYWNTAIFQPIPSAAGHEGLLKTLWLLVPVLVFSFNHSPIISSFALSQKEQHGEQADEKSARIMKYSHLLMVGTVMFFVFSCVLSLSPADMLKAKQQNISILSYLANHFQTPLIATIAPVIAFIAIAKSFLGHYLGAKEGLYGMLTKAMEKSPRRLSSRTLHLTIKLFMILSCWLVATINPSILGMIESLGGPVIALILFLMPVYAIYKVPALKKYRSPCSNLFIAILGLTALSAMLFALLH